MSAHPTTDFTVNAVLCDSAVTAEGKVYIQGGGWNILGTNGFPFNQPRIGLAVVVGIPYTATNQNHRFSVELEGEDSQLLPLSSPPADDPTGEPQMAIEAQFNIGRPPHIQPGDAQTIPFAINFDQLRFESPGAFAFVMKIDGREVERLVFRVMLPVGMVTTPGR